MNGRRGEPHIKQITQIMAFNFLEIKRLGAMYRAIESALARFPNESLRGTQAIVGRQILAESQVEAIQGFRSSVFCNIRNFPQPKYSIGQYVQFWAIYETFKHRKYQGLIIGLTYHHQTDQTPGWWYEIDAGESGIRAGFEESEYIHEDHIEKNLPNWKCPETPDLDEESQMLLESFLDHFEKSHGPLFPPTKDQEVD